MKVILQKDIPNLGEAGDTVEVKNGYARNFLIPRNMVFPATEANQKQKRHQDRLIKIKKDKRDKQAKALAEKFTNIVCEFKMRVGDLGKLFGSVTALDIAQNLYAQGYSIDKRKVHLPESIKQLGEYTVAVKLAEGVEAKVNVRVMDLDGNLEFQASEKEADVLEAEAAATETQVENTADPSAESVSDEKTEASGEASVAE